MLGYHLHGGEWVNAMLSILSGPFPDWPVSGLFSVEPLGLLLMSTAVPALWVLPTQAHLPFKYMHVCVYTHIHIHICSLVPIRHKGAWLSSGGAGGVLFTCLVVTVSLSVFGCDPGSVALRCVWT